MISLTHTGAQPKRIFLPSPALGTIITMDDKTHRVRSAAGTLREFRYGRPIWTAERKFEMLNEVKVRELFDWIAGLRQAPSNMVSYKYTDPRDGTDRTNDVTLIATPIESRHSLNITDITLKFEHTVHPDYESDRDMVVDVS